jgi:hypothetical protein
VRHGCLIFWWIWIGSCKTLVIRMAEKEQANGTRAQFDEDIKDIVSVNIVHGSWRNEDVNRIRLVVR